MFNDSATLSSARASGAAVSSPYARCIENSRRVRWDIERDVIRGRSFDFSKRFLPDALSRVDRLEFLDAGERRLLSQIQGRTYANMFGLVERFIAVKMLQQCSVHCFGDQTALEALVRFTDEELKHQALFRRIDQLVAAGMPPGYSFAHDPDAVAARVLQASSWAVLALTCHIELFTQVHYRHSIAADEELSELYRDVFLFHWQEESQHAVLDELEWAREDAQLTLAQRDHAVDDFIGLVGAVDALVQAQAHADALYFQKVCGRALPPPGVARVTQGLRDAYRWQYIVSGALNPRFRQTLDARLTAEQRQRVQVALVGLMQDTAVQPLDQELPC